MSLPDHVDAVLAPLGIPSLGVNPAAFQAEETSLAYAHGNITQAASAANATVHETVDPEGERDPLYAGESATALAASWQKNASEDGRFDQAAAAFETARRVSGMSASLEAAMLLAAGAVGYQTIREIRPLLLTGHPLARVAAFARILLARERVAAVRHEGARGAREVLGPLLRRQIEALSRITSETARRNGAGAPATALAGITPGRTPRLPGAAGPEANIAMRGRGWIGGSSRDAENAAADAVEMESLVVNDRADRLEEFARDESERGADAAMGGGGDPREYFASAQRAEEKAKSLRNRNSQN